MSSFDSEIEAGEYETLASLAEDLVFRLPGCADLMVRKTIESVYRDFCKKTCCMSEREMIPVVDTPIDVNEEAKPEETLTLSDFGARAEAQDKPAAKTKAEKVKDNGGY